MTRVGGYLVFGACLTIVCLCGGLIAWKMSPSKPPVSVAPTIVASPTPLPLPPVSAPHKPPPWANAVSTIIDLPGDPVVVQRGVVAKPRELQVALPVKVAANAPKVESVAYFVTTTLVSTDGGYMGKFPEAGHDAEPLAQQLEANAAAIASSGDAATSGEVMDDDGGAQTPDNPQDLMLTDNNSNRLEVALGATPQLKQTILKVHLAEKISDLLISNGYSEDSARAVEEATKASTFPRQTLLPGSIALAVGAQDPSGAYRVTQLSIYERQEYVGTIAQAENGGYFEGARPQPPPGMLDDAANAVNLTTRYTLADGIYSAGLRNAMPEPVIREAIQMLGVVADLKAPAPADETIRALYARDFRGKSKTSGKLIYIGLAGSAGAFDCYVFEAGDGGFGCYDPRARTSPTAPATLGDSGAVSVGGILAPIKGAPVTSLFGMRFHPILHILRLHAGIDFGAPVGSQVRASADGKIEFAGPASGFGNHIKIQHKGFETSYSHLSEIPASIKVGQDVTQGEIIALSGDTGLSTGPHLHFEFYLNGSAVDPLPHLGAEVQATAPKAGAGVVSTGPAVVGAVGASEAEKAAFPAIKAQIDAAVEAALK